MKRERKKKNAAGVNQKRHIKNNTEKFSGKTKILFTLLIAFITFISFFPTFDNEITTWDDEFYINTNPYLKDLSFENVKTLFDTGTYYMGNYHPLAMISLSVDYAIGGEDAEGNVNPFMFHFTNFILYLLTVTAVLYFIYILFKDFKLAAAAALLFAVHTLHVESVAWISERKDVLYAFFFVLSLIAYVKYTDNGKIKFYVLSLLLFVLSLFSKGQAVSLAVTLVLIDYFRGRKLIDKKLILEKIPFFILALVFGLIAVGAQQSEALVDEQGYDFIQRIAIASYALVMYILQLFLPLKLSAIYPYPDIIRQTLTPVYYFMIIPAAATVFLFYFLIKNKKKELVFALGFFLINIFLLLQFIPVGSAVHADRYAYIPSIGYAVFIAYLLFKVIEKYKAKKILAYSLFGFYVLILGILTFKRCDIWQNSETLWEDTVKKSPTSVVAQNNLGSWKDRQAAKALEDLRFKDAEKYRKEAISYFTKAIKGKPDYKNAYYNRGVSELELGKLVKDTNLIKKAVKDFTKALEQDAQFADAYHNRANAESELGDIDAAIRDFNLAIEFNPEDANYYTNRGVAEGKKGNAAEAIKDFNKAIELNPGEPAIYSNRGKAKMMLGKIDEAIKDYDYAVKLDPSQYTAFLNRALAKQKTGKFKEALSDFNKCIDLNPEMYDAYYYRAVLYLDMNRKDNACSDLKKAYQNGIGFAGILLKRYCDE